VQINLEENLLGFQSSETCKKMVPKDSNPTKCSMKSFGSLFLNGVSNPWPMHQK
jgi:hypothetical protein